MKYYDVTYKKPVTHDEGHPALGKMIALQVEDSATIDDVKNMASYLIGVGAPWDVSLLEILSVVESPEENLPRPTPLEED
jgi:hypothetical protein